MLRYILITVSFFALLVTLPLASALSTGRTPPPSTILDSHLPGVGFDLSPSRATVAVSYRNGTIVDVGAVEASDAYRDTMRRLSLPESRHHAPPYRSSNEAWTDAPRSFARRLRKSIGLSPSADVGQLAAVMAQLRRMAEDHLQVDSIVAAAVTVPPLMALTREDIVDAFDLTGLREVPDPVRTGSGYRQQEGLIFPSMSIVAANDIGTCEHYEARSDCRGELNSFHAFDALAIGVYDSHLTVSKRVAYSAYDFGWATDYDRSDLGYAQALVDRDYWTKLREAVRHFSPQELTRRGSTKVFLYGDADALADARVAQTVRQYLSEFFNPVPDIHMHHPDRMLARGTAVLAREFGSRLMGTVDVEQAPDGL